MIAISVSGTKSYLHAFPQCVRAIASAGSHLEEAHFILVTDESKEGNQAEEVAKSELPDGWKVTTIKLPIGDDASTRYKEEAQIRIAALQGAGFAFARKIRAEKLLIVESDTIIPADAIRVLEWTLKMPQADGSPLYDVAAGTYPNGLFLGGFGTPQNPIAEDFLPSEKKLPPRLLLCIERNKERIKKTKDQKIVHKEMERATRLHQRAKKYPPDGNIFEVNAKHGWRRRGWMDFAYPGIGRGAVVPSDWCGLGVTMLSQKALAHADFCGYDGRGTQDLFLCWQRWHPNGLKIACVPHIVADHIKRKSDHDDKDAPDIIHYRAYHEQEGECRGHLRVRQQKFLPL
jgi:hypothetical protein